MKPRDARGVRRRTDTSSSTSSASDDGGGAGLGLRGVSSSPMAFFEAALWLTHTTAAVVSGSAAVAAQRPRAMPHRACLCSRMRLGGGESASSAHEISGARSWADPRRAPRPSTSEWRGDLRSSIGRRA